MVKTKITDSEKLNEIKKISDRLDADEEVFQAIRQTKNPLKPGGSLFTPDSIFATNKRVIIRNPSVLGLRQKIESYSYEKITDVKLEKGILSSQIIINVPGSVFDGVIDAIPKNEAEALLKTIYDGITSAKKEAQGGTTTQQVSIADELKKLAKLKEQGIISEEEFSKMKQDLINKSSS